MEDEQQKDVRKIIDVIEQFRLLNAEMQASQMALFLHVVASPDLTIKELAQRAGMTLGGTIARNLDALSDKRRIVKNGTPQFVDGHGLIAIYEDPQDRRYKRVRPTQKGLRLCRTLLNNLR